MQAATARQNGGGQQGLVGNSVPGMERWLWTFMPLEALAIASALARELWRGIEPGATADGRHRDARQLEHVELGARGVVAYFVATGQAVPPVRELLERDRNKCAEAHHYKLRTAHNLSKPEFGFIWHEQDTQYRGVTSFLLLYPHLENERQWAIVGERDVESVRQLSSEGTWLPTENKVLPHGYLQPYAGPVGGPPVPFEYCEHREEIGRRCFACEPLRLELFPKRDSTPTGNRRLVGSRQR